MERSEAIKVLSDCTIYHGGKATREALDLAIEALDKQIPQKPKCETNIYKETVYFCICGDELYCLDKFNNEFGHKACYCESCGQAIGWSEE